MSGECYFAHLQTFAEIKRSFWLCSPLYVNCNSSACFRNVKSVKLQILVSEEIKLGQYGSMCTAANHLHWCCVLLSPWKCIVQVSNNFKTLLKQPLCHSYEVGTVLPLEKKREQTLYCSVHQAHRKTAQPVYFSI